MREEAPFPHGPSPAPTHRVWVCPNSLLPSAKWHRVPNQGWHQVPNQGPGSTLALPRKSRWSRNHSEPQSFILTMGTTDHTHTHTHTVVPFPGEGQEEGRFKIRLVIASQPPQQVWLTLKTVLLTGAHRHRENMSRLLGGSLKVTKSRKLPL